MRWMRSIRAVLSFSLALAGCDKPQSENAAETGPAATASASATSPAEASKDASAPVDAGKRAMPERPVPKTEPTVTMRMPEEVQLKTIQYMTAMQAPGPGDANPDTAYATALVTQLKPIVASMDKGGGAEKAKLNRVEMLPNGRRIDLLLARGCDAEMPLRAMQQRAHVELTTLMSHGIFVVRCADSKYQCLQSTRDATDVLCTEAPRHK